MRRDLVEAARRGDHEAFEVLATSAGDRLYAVARLILRSSDLAEDAVQEALVRAWRQLPSLRDPDRFDAWLHRLVVNACADQGRQLRRWSTQVRPLPDSGAIDDDTEAVALRERLERWLSRLKPEQRAVVTVGGYAGKSVILHVPDDIDFSPSSPYDEDNFASYGVPGDEPSRYHQGSGQIDEFWILDAGDDIVILDAMYRPDNPGRARGRAAEHCGVCEVRYALTNRGELRAARRAARATRAPDRGLTRRSFPYGTSCSPAGFACHTLR